MANRQPNAGNLLGGAARVDGTRRRGLWRDESLAGASRGMFVVPSVGAELSVAVAFATMGDPTYRLCINLSLDFRQKKKTMKL